MFPNLSMFFTVFWWLVQLKNWLTRLKNKRRTVLQTDYTTLGVYPRGFADMETIIWALDVWTISDFQRIFLHQPHFVWILQNPQYPVLFLP